MKGVLRKLLVLGVVLGVCLTPLLGATTALRIYASDAIQPALDEAALAYRQDTGITVTVNYCKMKQAFVLARQEKGDLFISGHAGAYEAAQKEGLVVERSLRPLGYLRVALAVPYGNPQGIATLADLTRPGLQVGLGAATNSQLGESSEELLKASGMADAVHANVVARGDCCSKVAALLTDGKVEAALGWISFSRWAPGRIETIPLPSDLARPIPVRGMVLTTSEDPRAAARFLLFLRAHKGREIFAKYAYVLHPES